MLQEYVESLLLSLPKEDAQAVINGYLNTTDEAKRTRVQELAVRDKDGYDLAGECEKSLLNSYFHSKENFILPELMAEIDIIRTTKSFRSLNSGMQLEVVYTVKYYYKNALLYTSNSSDTFEDKFNPYYIAERMLTSSQKGVIHHAFRPEVMGAMLHESDFSPTTMNLFKGLSKTRFEQYLIPSMVYGISKYPQGVPIPMKVIHVMRKMAKKYISFEDIDFLIFGGADSLVIRKNDDMYLPCDDIHRNLGLDRKKLCTNLRA